MATQFVCDICSNSYSSESGKKYITLDVIGYKYIYACSSCWDVRKDLQLKDPLEMSCWCKGDTGISFYDSLEELKNERGSNLEDYQYGYYGNRGEKIPNLLIRYMRGDGTSERELELLAKDSYFLYILWNQADNYLAHEFFFQDLQELKTKIKEYMKSADLPDDAPYVVVTSMKELIDGHIADYYKYCRWTNTWEELVDAKEYPLESNLEWKVTNKFLKGVEDRLNQRISKAQLELKHISSLFTS